MKLSFIIPLYNAEPYVGKCLDSVLDCDLDKSEYEVIVVDDGSVDDGLAIVREYAERYPNIRIFHQENQGQSVARNWGIREAKGDYIWFVDSDDYVDATNIFSLLNWMKAKDIEICKFGMKVFKNGGSSWLADTECVEHDKIYTGEQVLLNGTVMGSVCNGIFLRKFLLDNNLSFFPGIVHQDSEFSIRSTALGKRMTFVKQYIYVYRYNENSITRSKSLGKKIKSYVSDAFVASNIREFVKQSGKLSNTLKDYLNDYAYAIVKGNLVSFLANKDEDSLKLFEAFMAKADELGEYPVKLKGNCLKNIFMGLVLNNKSIMTILIRIRNVF